MLQVCKIRFAILLISTVLLSGCAGKAPTQAVIDQHVQLVNEALASPELSEKAKDALKTCKAGLLSAEQSYKTEIAKFKADTRYWKAVSSFLFIIMILYAVYRVKKL